MDRRKCDRRYPYFVWFDLGRRRDEERAKMLGILVWIIWGRSARLRCGMLVVALSMEGNRRERYAWENGVLAERFSDGRHEHSKELYIHADLNTRVHHHDKAL